MLILIAIVLYYIVFSDIYIDYMLTHVHYKLSILNYANFDYVNKFVYLSNVHLKVIDITLE